jgi:protein-tyrosine phosphatase
MNKFQLLLAVALAIVPLAHAEIANLECTQTGPTTYQLTYAMTHDTHSVEIHASTSADGSSGLKLLLKTSDTRAVVNAGKPGERVYFFLKPDHGEQREVSIRHLPLQGTPNFRDLGGYETTDGRFVRWGLLYRSGVLTHLTPTDYAYLTPLGIRVVCDFRTAQENSVEPELWVPGVTVDHISLPIGDGNSKSPVSSLQQMLANNPPADQLRKRMTDTYGGFAFTNAPEYAKVLKQLEQDHLPLLYHCTAGKDRTGVFSALVLLTLGVPEKTVIADYALTNRYLAGAMTAEQSQKMLASNPGLAQATPEQRNVLIAADPLYLESTLRQINQRYGSFANYRRAVLKVSDQDVERLRSRLLER